MLNGDQEAVWNTDRGRRPKDIGNDVPSTFSNTGSFSQDLCSTIWLDNYKY
jgi:hypothetical protein